MAVVVKLVLASLLIVQVFGSFGLGAGSGICTGGSCGQCSPVVYHTETSVLVSIQGLSQKLMQIISVLTTNSFSLNQTINSLSVTSNSYETIYINQIKQVNSLIINSINQLAVGINWGDKDFVKLQESLTVIQRIQTLVIASSKSIASLSNQILHHHGKFKESTVISINDLLIALARTKETILYISQGITGVANDVASIVSQADSASVSVIAIEQSINAIKQSIVSFISVQQSFVTNLGDIIALQTTHISSMTNKINAISASSAKIFNGLQQIQGFVGGYQSSLTQINSNINSVNSVVSDVQQKISTQNSQIANILSKIRQVDSDMNAHRKEFGIFYSHMQSLLKGEGEFLQEINNLLAYINREHSKVKVVLRDTAQLMSTISAKITTVTSAEERNFDLTTNIINRVASDIQKMKEETKMNGQIAVKMASDVAILEERMDEIMKYLGELTKQCKDKPQPPVGRCEGAEYFCIVAAPVCGSDFMTYDSICDMRKVACLLGKVITFEYNGPCRPVTPPPNPCLTLCTPSGGRVCGSDGNTYNTGCNLRILACLQKSGVTVAYNGPCQATTTPNPCMSLCTSSGGQVCGSDGNTYITRCSLLVMSCLRKIKVVVAFNGPCNKKCSNIKCAPLIDPVCGSNGMTYSCECAMKLNACYLGITLTKAYHGPCKIKCMMPCPTIYKPVCGSNRVDYSSECDMRRAACTTNTVITKLYNGKCKPCIMAKCIFIIRPICGSNGVTYTNDCALLNAKCNLPDLKKVHDGPCKVACMTMCPTIFKPVCGSNNKDYSNECVMRRAACTTQTVITKKHDGKCKPCALAMCVVIDLPVCGTNGVTYRNDCDLTNAKCTIPNLEKAYDGRC